MERVERKSKTIWLLHSLISLLIRGGIAGVIYFFFHDVHKGFQLLFLYIGYRFIITLYNVTIRDHYRYQNLQYVLQEDDLFIYDGGLIITETVVPYRKIQHLQLSQDYISRFFHLYTLFVQTAGSSFDIQYVTKEKAEQLKEEIRKRLKDEEEEIDEVS